MKRILTLLFLFNVIHFLAQGQQGIDSASVVQDSVQLKQDSVLVQLEQQTRDSISASVIRRDSLAAVTARVNTNKIVEQLKSNKYFRFGNPSLLLKSELKLKESHDQLFYILAFIVFYFAIVRLLFDKYFSNLVTLFFRITMRQQQLRDQLLQAPLPSLLLNILFILSGGFYLSFLSFHYKIADRDDFWLIYLYCIGFLVVVYIGKFLFLKIMGWIFNVSNATDTYIFIVFLINKMMGIFLLPILFLMAFPHPVLYDVALTLSYILIVVLFLYRFLISYAPVRNDINVNKFHFFIYLCAFEITPLLLIYKVLLKFVETTT